MGWLRAGGKSDWKGVRVVKMWRRGVGVLSVVTMCACSSPTGPGALDPEVNCSVFPAPHTSMYVLPYAVGQRFTVSNTFGHYLASNGGVGLYAIDVPMPIGTPVRAMRSGTVVAVEERFSDDDKVEYHQNWVMIRHADETVARYLHLTRDGALVDVGAKVVQGQLIGLSGNSGPSNGPHLHFDVQTCGPNLPPGYNRLPCGMTIPLSFRNADPHVCGLEKGRSYTALPFEADLR